MNSEEALWAHVSATLAVQMQMISAIIAMAPSAEHARQTLAKFEADTLQFVPEVARLHPHGATPATRAAIAEVISGVFAGFHLSEKPRRS